MGTFSFKPDPKAEAEERERIRNQRVYWVEFKTPVERVFCDGAHCASVIEADYGVTWMGVSTPHWPKRVPTDKPDVWCYEFGVPIDLMAVAAERMGGWMEVVRSNGIKGRYREAGTDRWYEF